MVSDCVWYIGLNLCSEKKNYINNLFGFFYFRSTRKATVYNNNPGAEDKEKEISHNILLQYFGIFVNEILCYGGDDF
jgi:hypothetical protein